MEVRPILSALMRNKAGLALIVAQVAITLAVICNSLFIVVQRAERVGRDSGIDEAGTFTIDSLGFAAGFDLRPGNHPIVPVMLYDAKLAQRFASELLEEGVYVIGFFYPVVPQGQARIRTQISAAHSIAQIDRAVDAFIRVGKRLGVI